MTRPPEGYQTVTPYLLYEDAARAVAFLTEAFGFVERRTTVGGAGRDHHELVLGTDGLVMLGQAWPGYRGPLALGAHPSSLIHVYVPDVASLHARAQAAGARPTEIELAPSGDKRFTATDLEGQVWVFAERVRGPIQ
jgi:PhnB protein